MESVLILLLLIVIFLFVIFNKKKSHKNFYPPRKNTAPKKYKEKQRSNDPTCTESPAKPVVLKGSAYVIDGDTVVIHKTQIRLFGIDAPELNHPYGKKAKWALVSLCKGQKLRAEISQIDIHGRTVAHCYLHDGRDLSAEMVKLGLALDWPKFSGGKYSALEQSGVRKKLWLADARQKGRMHIWERYDAKSQVQENK